MSKQTKAHVCLDTKRFSELKNLSFVKTGRHPIYWHVKNSGDYYADFATGEEYARELMNFIFTTNFLPIYGWIIKSMHQVKKHQGIEAGFCHKIINIALQHWGFKVVYDRVKAEHG